MNPTERQRRLDQFVQAHRDNSLPVTLQRRTVFEAVLEREDHPTADQVFESVREQVPDISRMTVYRILGNLVSLGLLTKSCHPGSVARFDPKIHQHHHLVCLECGDILDWEEERLNKVKWPDVHRLGFEIEDYHIHFRGHCAACRQAAKKSKKPKTKK
jgi:Fur family peroxide stress response transcriptional regulator